MADNKGSAGKSGMNVDIQLVRYRTEQVEAQIDAMLLPESK